MLKNQLAGKMGCWYNGVMAKTYAIANQKGGVGKSSSCAAFGSAFSELEKRVLLVDLDPQGGLTSALGLAPETFEKTTYQVLLGQLPIAEATTPTKMTGVDLLPANLDLAGAEPELIREIGWERTLKHALKPVLASYDRVFLDCPPALGLLTTNALVAAETVIVPLQCEYLAMRGLRHLQQLIETVKRKANPGLSIRILRTMYDARTTHSRELSEEIEKVFGAQVFAPIIRRTVKFADSTVAGEPILSYAKSSDAAEAYREVAREI